LCHPSSRYEHRARWTRKRRRLESPGSYVDPTVKKIVYSSKGVTLPPTVDADPPDYKEAVQVSAGVSPVVVAAGVGAAILVFASWKKRKNDLESSQ